MSASLLTWLVGLGLFAVGERYAGGSSMHLLVSAAGLLLAGLGMSLRARELGRQDASVRKEALRGSLMWMGVGSLSVLLYLSTTSAFTGAVGMVEETQAWWYVVAYSLGGIALLLGALPAVFLDRALENHPVLLPQHAQRRAVESGILTALALALFAPVNYLASEHDVDWDYAYFRTTRAGDATLALTRTLPERVEVSLFFPAGNEVLRELTPYMAELESASGGQLTVRVADQALEPELSEKLRINDNGYIVFQQGEASDKWKVGLELDKAKRNLKKLDGEVQKRLLKLAKGERTVYMLAGHGEASDRERENPGRKLARFKKKLQEQGLEVKSFGATDGSMDAIPDDAAFLVVAAPTLPITSQEEQSIAAFLDRGGSMLVLVEPGREPLAGVLGPLGLEVTPGPLANETKIYPDSRTVADRILLVTNRFGAHDAIRELQRNAERYRLFTPSAGGLEKIEGGRGKQTAIVRSFPDTWQEIPPLNFRKDDAEVSKVWDIGVAIEGEGEQSFRVLAFADDNLFSDALLGFSAANERLLEDGARWLLGDEEIAGETESEEDVKVAHTREEDIVWFLASAFGLPLLFLFAGMVRIRARRK